ncbi:hypothetical protein CASFOL_040676 [Castilleja foliolosa]|uniref:Receptor-like serine/threonine-protein kinase n=1 Tax=Castilleja foliolosa TaxID=1961234 RepID=A0ABD3BCB4_9LAMI
MIMTMIILKQSLFLLLCFTFQGLHSETDTITPGFSITEPGFIVSTGRIFKLGFFSPENTTNRYLAIYYVVSENTTIWIANRDNPLTDSSGGTVTISNDGNLILINGRNQTIWSTNATSAAPANTTAQILDTGNLILREASTGNIIWDCFSHPTNVFIAGMRFTDNTITGHKMKQTSWKSPSDPGLGNYTAGLQALNIPQIFAWKNDRAQFRSGPWNGLIFMGIKQMYSPYLDGIQVRNDSGEFYFMSPPVNFLMRDELNSTGSLVKSMWNEQNRVWDIIWVAPENECDIYGMCGPFGVCNALNSPICSCLRGFEPANRGEWERGNWTSGCTRRKAMNCDGENRNLDDGFLRMPFMKVPDFAQPLPARRGDECRTTCLGNCSCLAYAHDLNIGCMFWSETLIDIQQFDGIGPDFYIRLASSELDNNNDSKLVIIIPVVVGVAFLSICIFIAWCWMAKRKGKQIKEQKALETLQSNLSVTIVKDESEKVNTQELPLFTFKTLADATNQFHVDNVLGRGGFGHVYRGKLGNGKVVAVKRLSAASGQGAKEFRNEMVTISKIQHRNLVKLLGSCVERDEKMLVYEYMPNKSLDAYLFDPMQQSRMILDWKRRFSIIEGIGRGLLYLHRDSRVRIVHRDLKLSNVLLDEDLNPKISDFGIARIFGGNQDQANTARVVGTYGYMPPEYAMNGRFSEKTDAYSFGVLMLEIVSGKKNTHYYNQEWSLSLLGCAWKLWNDDNGINFADPKIANTSFEEEIVRCIHIALLCVQEFPSDRPTVQTVLSMLRREIVDLPLPDQPAFAEKWDRYHAESSQTSSQFGFSTNEITVTELDGR